MININNFAFQGINGAYSELAGVKIFPKAKSLACPTFEEMFQSVRDGKAEVAMVPIENSQAGRVADTQRLIPESELKIIGEYFLEIKHNLLVVPGTKLSDIKRIHSHEQGIAQCRNKIIDLNKEMIIGLAIINPIYFTCTMIGVMKSIQLNISIILGAILGPLFYIISPDWCVLIGGFIAGTVAFVIGEKNVS